MNDSNISNLIPAYFLNEIVIICESYKLHRRLLVAEILSKELEARFVMNEPSPNTEKVFNVSPVMNR